MRLRITTFFVFLLVQFVGACLGGVDDLQLPPIDEDYWWSGHDGGPDADGSESQ